MSSRLCLGILRSTAVSTRTLRPTKALYSTSAAVPYSSYTPRVAIITGGSQGIGHAIARRLSDEGVDIAVNDIAAKKEQIDKVVEEVRQKGRRAIAVPADVSSEAEVGAMIDKTAGELGSVDIVGFVIE